MTPLKLWLQQARNHHADLYRLKAAQQPANYGDRVVTAAMQFLGRAYDDEWDWDDARLYCSELIWKSFWNGLQLKLSAPKDYFDELNNSPNALFWQGYFRGAIPHRLGVSPKDLAASPYLERIGILTR
jgi:hypothetical protein